MIHYLAFLCGHDKIVIDERIAKRGMMSVMEIKVNLKSIGRKNQSVKPAVYQIQGHPSTVRELILAVTESGVLAYEQHTDSFEILSYLTREEIEDRAQAGKISFGENHGENHPELRKAQDHAVQCFEDGIYRIFMDGKPLEILDEEICITKDSVFTFVRMTMLAGRMW